MEQTSFFFFSLRYLGLPAATWGVIKHVLVHKLIISLALEVVVREASGTLDKFTNLCAACSVLENYTAARCLDVVSRVCVHC